MRIKIWQRYFYSEIIKTFISLLAIFYALYITIDLMTHLKDLREGQTSFGTWVVFYACTFSRRFDVLVPFVILIGSIRVLLHFQSHHVFSSLLCAGMSLKNLYRPFLLTTSIFSLLMYANYEWILPKALPRALFIQENNFTKKSFIEKKTPFHECTLKDGSRVFYRTYNPSLNELYDVLWVSSLDKVYHIKKLSKIDSVPSGTFVDEIVRNDDGYLQRNKSFETRDFSELNVTTSALQTSVMQARDQSLSQLAQQFQRYDRHSDKCLDIRANLIYKCTFPLMTLIAFLAVAPFCLRFTRSNAPLMIYLIGISSLFCFLLLLQVAFVFAKSFSLGPWLLFIVWLTAFYAVSRRHVTPL